MVEFSKDEAKQILISMTKSGMSFDREGNFDKGSLVFKKQDDSFISAYVKTASAMTGRDITFFTSNITSTNEKSTHINDTEVVKTMGSYCQHSRQLV